jgi:hypothetical protein
MLGTWPFVRGQQPRNVSKQSAQSVQARVRNEVFLQNVTIYWGSLGVLEICFFIDRINTYSLLSFVLFFSLYGLFRLCLWPSIFFLFIIFFPCFTILLSLFFSFS